MKPTILFVITQGGPWGGAQRYVYDIAIVAAEHFHVVVAIGESKGSHDLQQRLKDQRIEVVQLKYLRRDISPIYDILALFECKKLYKRHKPTIVHLNSTKAGIIGSIAKRLNLRNPIFSVVYTVHGWIFSEPMSKRKKTLYRFLEHMSMKQKDRLIVLSEQERNLAEEMLVIAPNKLSVIPHGIDPPTDVLPRDVARANLRELLQTPLVEDCYWIGAIANFYPTKGLDILIQAVAENRTKNIHAILIGDGPERFHLETLIKKLDVSSFVTLAGFIPNAASLLPAFDLFVNASRKEGLPYALLEAAIHGVPVIATDVGGVRSIVIHEKTGYLVPADDERSLAEAIRFATEHTDSMRQLALCGKEYVETQFSKPAMVQKTISLYQSLLPAKSP